MNTRTIAVPALASLLLLTGCASTGDLLSAPEVSLRDVEATDLGFSEQAFVLQFDVRNPNPFPLPVSSVRVGVDLDGYRFATVSTPASIMVPASGEAEFAATVEVDLLRTAPQLLYVVRDSLKRDIPYQLSGEFALDIPLADAVQFQTQGAVRLREITSQALKSH